MLRLIPTVVLAAALVAPAPATADDYFKDTPSSTSVEVRYPKQRTLGQRLTIYGLLGGGAIFAGLGAWSHVESRDKSKELEIAAVDPEETWTQDRQDLYDDAVQARSIAAVSYVLSAGFLAGAAVAAYLTRPGYETVTVHPTQGGAMLGGTWTW